MQSILGLSIILAACWLCSENRTIIKPRLVGLGLALQVFLAMLLLKVPAMKDLFGYLNLAVQQLQLATEAGTSFIFGFIGGGQLPYEETIVGGSYIVAFRALPILLITSVLSALLIYWRILPLIMRTFSFVLERTLGVGGAVGLSVAANAFIGMVESPLLIRPYLARLTRSEMFTVMCAGLATISGSMLALEATVIGNAVPDAVGHLLSASLITLPGVIVVGHILIPETDAVTGANAEVERGASSAMDAIATGTHNGLTLLLNIIAMIIVMVGLVYLVNVCLGLLPDIAGAPMTLQRLLGYLMAPVTWLLGLPWSQALVGGQLMGIKTILTEFLAYIELGSLPETSLSLRSRIIMTYALCGFANFVSLGIMLTGLITMVPERRSEILELGIKSLIGGTIATCSTAAIVGALL